MSEQITAYAFAGVTVAKHRRELDPLYLKLDFGDKQVLLLSLSRDDLVGMTAYLMHICNGLEEADDATPRN